MANKIVGGVAGWTKITTDKGDLEIRELMGQKVKVWNGQVFSEVVPVHCATDAPSVIIIMTNGTMMFCATDQVFQKSDGTEVYADSLEAGDWLSAWTTMQGNMDISQVKEITSGPSTNMYCIDEPLQHRYMANGIMISSAPGAPT